MCLLYCLCKENTHTSCKNRSARLPQHAPATAFGTLAAVNVREPGAPRGAVKLGAGRAKGQRRGGGWWYSMCWTAGLWTEGGWMGGWVEQLGE